MERLVRDIRYAARRLARRPLFAAVAIVSLSIGIGANTAIFSLVNAVILRHLPVARPEELVDVYRSTAGFSHATFSYPDLYDLERETGDIFQEIAFSRLAQVQSDVEGGVEILPAEIVSGNYFPLLGVPAYLGRTLLPEDDVTPGGHFVVVLSHGFWQRRYAGDRSVVGRKLRLNGRPYTIVGVAPKAYTGNIRGVAPDVYAPTMMVGQLQPGYSDELRERGNRSVFGKARLKPGVSLARAQAVVNRIADAERAQYPGDWQAGDVITLVPTAQVIMNPMIDRVIVPAAALMLVVGGLVLLIACANLATFLLAQAADRRKEVAIRLAVGANRGPLMRQFLTEAMLLALAGGGAGILLAKGLLTALVGADLPLPLPISLDLSLDRTVLGFSLLVTLVAGLLFGMAPALQATGTDVAPTLKDESTGGGRPRSITLRGALVATQVAVSLMLLVGAGLFLRSFRARLAVDPGFGYDPAAIVTVQTVPERYTTEAARVFFRSLVGEVAALPGVRSVGLTGDLPLSPLNNLTMNLKVDGVDPPPGQDYHTVDWAQVDPGFFDAAGVRIARGRAFDDRDRPQGSPVAIVSEAMARRFWPGVEAVGRTFRRGETEVTVVGVARDAKVRSLGEEPRPFVYRPFAQAFSSRMTLVARTSSAADPTVAAIVRVARRLDPDLLIFEAKTMERHLAVMLLPHRLSALIVSAFGCLALLLASIGLYGVVNYAVATRSREVGIRLALGADAGGVVRLLMSGALRLVAVGGVIGLVLSVLSGQLLGRLLYGVKATDSVTFVLVPLVLAAVAVLAAWLPARRAGRVNPVRALKAQ